jgi:hypothetical protein
MPVEFQGAAYRFGHSMVRPSYRANLAGDDGHPFFAMIFDPAGEGQVMSGPRERKASSERGLPCSLTATPPALHLFHFTSPFALGATTSAADFRHHILADLLGLLAEGVLLIAERLEPGEASTILEGDINAIR